jgi:excisionase family DNA binding protein
LWDWENAFSYTIKEAAEVLNVSTDWLYRNQRYKTLPFTVILSPRKIQFSLQGLLTWLKEQQYGRQSVEEGRDVSHRV